MKQRDIVVAPRGENFAEGAILLVGERRGIADAAVEVGNTVDFLLIKSENALFDSRFEHRLRHGGPLQEFSLGHLLGLVVLQPVREVEKRQQQRFLLLGASYRVEILVQRGLVALLSVEGR